jgi:hypothetical protein
MPTYVLMKQIAERRAKNREEKMENDDASYRNIKYVPALNIDPKDCYPEPLHMRLRIVGLFERIRARMAGIDPSTVHANDEYKQLLKKMGIYRGITGVTGGECRRILEGRDTFCEGVKKHSKHGALVECMRMFHWLDTHQTNTTSPQEWKKCAREFRRLMMKNFQRWCGASIYLHVLATHGYRFMPLHSFSTQALERMHVLFKQAKRGWSVDDKKEESDKFTYHQNTKQLCQMMKWVLSRNCSWINAYIPPKKKKQCSKCHGMGHNKKRCYGVPPKSAITIPSVMSQPPTEAKTIRPTQTFTSSSSNESKTQKKKRGVRSRTGSDDEKYTSSTMSSTRPDPIPDPPPTHTVIDGCRRTVRSRKLTKTAMESLVDRSIHDSDV